MIRSALTLVPFVLTACLSLAAAVTRADEAPWEWRPYRVAFHYEADADPRLPESFVTELRATVEQRLRATFAGAWQMAEPSADKNAAVSDKRLSVQLSYQHGEYQVAVCEEDTAAGTNGPAAVRRSPQRETLGDLLYEAIVAAYRPTATIVESRTGGATLRLRAAELYPPETRSRLLRRGEAFVPFVRRIDRDGRVLETQSIPWTLLTIDEVRGGEATCLVRSGLSNPLGVTRRGRNERLAITVGRPSGSTTLQITSRTGRPLAGCRVLIDRGTGTAEPAGTTDLDGRITFVADDGKPWTVIATSRFMPLAKLPLVPGLVPELTAATSGEPELLAAEERLVTWQSTFLDGFIERRVLLALAEAHVEREDRAAAESLLARIDAGTKPLERRTELEALARRFAAAPGGSQRAIAAMFADAEKAVASLDDSAQVAELRKAVARLKP